MRINQEVFCVVYLMMRLLLSDMEWEEWVDAWETAALYRLDRSRVKELQDLTSCM